MFNANQYIWANDNYDKNNSHFSALIRKVFKLKLQKNFITLWGDGRPKKRSYSC